MKKLNILFWITTVLFSGFMLFSAIPNVTLEPEAVEFMGKMGYAPYFVLFIGIAKILGVIGILIPGDFRIKEWAYAGLFFDLAGAIYSVIAVYGFDPGVLFIALPIVFLFASYFLWHKKMRLRRSMQTIR